ncbi:hypothetical protein Mmc1_0145 [Magnetococcus marinus MC-1]|uniref:Uncharacterized protein n=1 Tax=Magnetococcus marinus (strain ATCC BAA-1437 / JCM 17883 / MC-1) TaxID=156889 RepID=A0L3X9_MAGMM|nr:hypothetical protein [Magnetococcus marinus]ABK42672.1 hypothetical protein Mmc1_0145 [Magnetococcus marinus MC-1]
MGQYLENRPRFGYGHPVHCDKRLLRVISFQRLMGYMGRWLHGVPSQIGTQQDFQRRVKDLRGELDYLDSLGMVLPHVANRHNGLHGDPHHFTTFADALELTIDTILGRITTRRADRYKSDDFSAYLALTLKEQQAGCLPTNRDGLHTLNIRARQLGCVLTAMVTLLMTREQWRELFIYAYDDEQLGRYAHLEAQLTRGRQWIPDYLSYLGITGSYLLQRRLQRATTDPGLNGQDCQALIDRIHATGFDDERFLAQVNRARQTALHASHGCREFIMDDAGGWQERVHGGHPGRAWTALVPYKTV